MNKYNFKIIEIYTNILIILILTIHIVMSSVQHINLVHLTY